MYMYYPTEHIGKCNEQETEITWLAHAVKCQIALQEVTGLSPRLDQHSGS